MATRPRILFAAQPTITGVAQCVVDWTSGLKRRGWDVSLASPDDGWLADRCAAEGVDTHRWQAVNQPYRGVVGELRRLREIVAMTSPDVVYLNGSKAGMIGRLLLRNRIPTAFSPHSWSFEASEGLVGFAALRWEQAAARWTAAYVCVSEAEAAAGRAHGISGHYVVARNGVDTTKILPASPRQRQVLRAAKGIQPDTVCAVCVGRVHRQKGQDVLLAAWPQVQVANSRLVIVGDGPLYEQWSVAPPVGVEFVGGVDRDEALKWMQLADLLVMPSRWEGMALVPLESLAVGTPVIASDVTGAREAVDATCGAVVPSDDPPALAAALRQWLPRVGADPGALREAARRRVVGDFELSQTVDTLDATMHMLRSSGR